MRAGVWLPLDEVKHLLMEVYVKAEPYARRHAASAALAEHDRDVMRDAVSQIAAGVELMEKYDGYCQKLGAQ